MRFNSSILVPFHLITLTRYHSLSTFDERYVLSQVVVILMIIMIHFCLHIVWLVGLLYCKNKKEIRPVLLLIILALLYYYEVL